ncbi:MAG: CoA transferase [Proteobacteria bacterium]|nr:CoA transferase [Pseudomonadota bacterium]
MNQAKPLAGVRVLDLTQLLPGPMCTLHLADMGAEVIKIEPPRGGDPTRGLDGEQFNGMFLMLNRNKRSLALDLRTDEGVAVLHRLAERADVLVEGFRPGVAERLGIGYARLAEINPRLVYCSITGYGQDGPLAQAAGHDINYESLAGVLEQTGVAGGPPAQGHFPVADLAGGALSAAMGILAALLGARNTGHGSHVDVAMTDCLMVHNIMSTVSWQRAGQAVPRGADFLSGGIACYGVYETADGRHLAVGAIEPKFWTAFCNAIERPDLYARGHVGGAKGAEARTEVAAVLRAQTLAHWQAVFANVDACVTPVLRVDEAVAHPHAQARSLLREDIHPVAGRHSSYAFPIRMSGYRLDEARPAPALGADNAAIYAELGLAPQAA